mgnify:FL=1
MKRRIILFIGFLALIVLAAACQTTKDYEPEFEKLCKDRTPDNWMNMGPMKEGKFTLDTSCWGCMSDDGMSHYCSIGEYREYLSIQKKNE